MSWRSAARRVLVPAKRRGCVRPFYWRSRWRQHCRCTAGAANWTRGRGFDPHIGAGLIQLGFLDTGRRRSLDQTRCRDSPCRTTPASSRCDRESGPTAGIARSASTDGNVGPLRRPRLATSGARTLIGTISERRRSPVRAMARPARRLALNATIETARGDVTGSVEGRSRNLAFRTLEWDGAEEAGKTRRAALALTSEALAQILLSYVDPKG